MKLSDRLSMIASLVDINTRVIDIGCDHAYLDIYLTLNNQNECIATDINKGAIDNAKANIKKYNLERKIKVKKTDGLNGIKVKEDDNIVISGMGAFNIINILKDKELSNTLILSANNNVDILRKEVVKLGYIIDTEIFLYDNNKPYIIIKFIKGNKKYSDFDYLIGPILKHNPEYKKYILNKYKKIYRSVKSIKDKIKLFILIKKIKRA